MVLYEIIETDAGLAVAEMDPHMMPEEAAVRRRGIVVDPGPYKSYDEAYDAMLAIAEEDAGEDEF